MRAGQLLGCRRLSAEEQPLEALGPPSLLELEDALGVLARTCRAPNAKSTTVRLDAPMRAGRTVVRICSVTKKPIAGLDRPLHRRHTRGHDEHDEHQREARRSSRSGSRPAAPCCGAGRRCRRWPRTSANTMMRCQVRFTPSPAVAVSLPRMAARLRPTVPLRTWRTTTTATTSTPSDEKEHGVPVEVEEGARCRATCDWMLTP